MTTKNIGSEGFKWFFGIVEDRDDPLKLGRVKVRINTVHNNENTQQLPTSQLPWATPLVPITSASKDQVGMAPVGPLIGSTVFGFFMDGVESQMPVYFGSMFGIPDKDPKQHDVPELAREINNLNKQLLGPEPPSAYNSRYPFNKVFRSESGHVFEVDDTPNYERLHEYHKSGTYREVDASGRRVEKIVGDDYEIVVKNKTVYVQGNVNIQINGNASITCPQATVVCPQTTWNGNITLNGNLTVTGNIVGEDGVTGGGIDLETHVHSDPQGGTTGAPS